MSTLSFKPMFDTNLIQKFEYDVEAVRWVSGLENKDVKKLVIRPIELGNLVEFLKKDGYPLLHIPIDHINAIQIVEQQKGKVFKKSDKLIEMKVSIDGTPFSLLLNVDDKHAPEIVNLVDKFRFSTKDLLKPVDLPAMRDNMPSTVKFYPRLPFFNEGETLVWGYHNTGGILHKHLSWSYFITNYRVFTYDYNKHDTNGLSLLTLVDDVVVINQHTKSDNYVHGTYVGVQNVGLYSGPISGSSITVGDVQFMYQGKPWVIFFQIEDPQGVAELARSTIKYWKEKAGQLLSGTQVTNVENHKKGQQTSMRDSSVCVNCGNKNPKGAAFCNKCGLTLR